MKIYGHTLDKAESIELIHDLVKEYYGDNVAVTIFINSEGIKVSPEYRTNMSGYSMKTIDGKWVKKIDL